MVETWRIPEGWRQLASEHLSLAHFLAWGRTESRRVVTQGHRVEGGLGVCTELQDQFWGGWNHITSLFKSFCCLGIWGCFCFCFSSCLGKV